MTYYVSSGTLNLTKPKPKPNPVEHLLIVVETDWREGDRVRKGEGREVRRRKRDGREGDWGTCFIALRGIKQ